MNSPGSNMFQGSAMYQSHFGDRSVGDGASHLCVVNNGAMPHFCGVGNASPPNSMGLNTNSGAVAPSFSPILYIVDANGMPSPVYYSPMSPTGSPGGTGICASSPIVAPQQQTYLMNVSDEQAIACMPMMMTSPGQQGSVSPLIASGGFNSRTNSPSVMSEGNISPALTSLVGQTLQGTAINGFPQLSQRTPFAQHFSTDPVVHGANPGANNVPVKSTAACSNDGQTVDEDKKEKVNSESYVEVYSPDFTSLLFIHASCIVHQPPSDSVSRLVLCRKYVSGRPNSCWKGNTCRFVHADASGAPRSSVHVNYAWQNVERCTYQRLPSGEVLRVLAPNERQPLEKIPSERILVTQGSLNRKTHVGPLSHCAHYYFNRLCNRGENCNFIHAVYVDPQVTVEFRRAPAPTAIVPVQVRNSCSKKMTSDGEISDKKNNRKRLVNRGQNNSDFSISPACVDHSHALFCGVGGNDLAMAGASTNSCFYLDIPRNASGSVSPVGDGSVCSGSSLSGPSQVMDWSFVENLDNSPWTERDPTPTQ